MKTSEICQTRRLIVEAIRDGGPDEFLNALPMRRTTRLRSSRMEALAAEPSLSVLLALAREPNVLTDP